jgi:hypothetical protein
MAVPVSALLRQGVEISESLSEKGGHVSFAGVAFVVRTLADMECTVLFFIDCKASKLECKAASKCSGCRRPGRLQRV